MSIVQIFIFHCALKLKVIAAKQKPKENSTAEIQWAINSQAHIMGCKNFPNLGSIYQQLFKLHGTVLKYICTCRLVTKDHSYSISSCHCER